MASDTLEPSRSPHLNSVAIICVKHGKEAGSEEVDSSGAWEMGLRATTSNGRCVMSAS